MRILSDKKNQTFRRKSIVRKIADLFFWKGRRQPTCPR